MKKSPSIKTQITEDTFAFFKALWDELEDEEGYVYCFETGTAMYRDYYRNNSCIYSHILSKSKYPEYRLEKWNVKIVTPLAHTQYGSNPDKAPKQKAYRDKLIKELGL